MSQQAKIRSIIIRTGLPVLMIAFGLTAAAMANDNSAPPSYEPTIGQPHPDFVLPRIDDGKPLRLSDYRGQKVLLIHFASW